MQGMYRSLSYVGKHAVVVEPLHLFGDTAPAPGEIVLSGLWWLPPPGITAVAMQRQADQVSKSLKGDI
jgi:hypothetical protein